MALKEYPINLLSKQLSNYDIGEKWAEITRLLEEYCITEGFHSLNEVPQGSEPIDNGSLDEEFVWIPYTEGTARIMVMLPLCDADSIIIPGLSRLIMTYTKGLDSLLSGVVDAVDNSVSTFGNAITGLATAASNTIGQAVGEIGGEAAKNIIEGVGNKVKSKVGGVVNQILGGAFGEIIGIARPIGMDDKYEYYMFDFGADIVPIGAILHYDSKKVRLMEPTKRLGNGIKERFIAEGGMGYIIGQGGGAGGAAGAGGFGGGGFGGGSKGGNPINAPAGFLWKPISDSTGKLAVLVPERSRTSCIVNGESGAWGGIGNGSRAHYRFSKPGGAYGDGVTCQTSVGTFIIPHGALRYEGNGGQEVTPEDNGPEGGGE